MKITIDTTEIEISDEKLAVINRKLDTAAFLNAVVTAVNSTINVYALAGQEIINKDANDELMNRLELLKTADPATLATVDAAIGYVKGANAEVL